MERTRGEVKLRITVALLALLVLGGCQDSAQPQTTAEKYSSRDMEIATTQENDSSQWGIAAAEPAAGPSVKIQTKADELDFPRDSTASYSVFNLNEYACLNDEMIRVVYVEYLGGAGQPPCTVVYKKSPPEQPSQEFLWNAETNVGFCEDNARELVEKLRAGGWKCGLYADVLGINE